MTFKEPFNFVKLIKRMIEKIIAEKRLGVSIWIVTDIKGKQTDGSITDYRCQIKNLCFKYSLDNVPMIGLGLGHKKGVITYPSIGDYVVVSFMDTKPIILGTVFDYFSQKPDSVPVIKMNELAIVQRENGSIILMKENNDVLIRASDSTGNFDNGARIRINADGSFKVFNKGNFGIEVDSAGNMTLRGVTINGTQTPGTW